MLFTDNGEFVADDGPTADQVRLVVPEPMPQLDQRRLAEVLDQVAAAAANPRARTLESSGLVRWGKKLGLPVPRGVAGLPGPTARNWLRGLIAAATGRDVVAAIAVEYNVTPQPVEGWAPARTVAPVPAERPAPVQDKPYAAEAAPLTRQMTGEDLTGVLKALHPEFPDVISPAARERVRRWEEASGQRYAWPADAPTDALLTHQQPVQPTDDIMATPEAVAAVSELRAALADFTVGPRHEPQRRLALAAHRVVGLLTADPTASR